MLLSGIWIVLVTFVVFNNGDLGTKWKELQRASAWERMISRVEGGIAAGGMTDNDGNYQSAQKLEDVLKGIKERQPEIREQTEKAKRWFLGLVGFLLVPTIGALLIGRAGIWVVDGFRSNQS
jgi:hypothetical protein